MSNWKSKTTWLGLAGAIFTACVPFLQNGSFCMHKDWPNLVAAAGLAFFGYFAKDYNHTGTPDQSK